MQCAEGCLSQLPGSASGKKCAGDAESRGHRAQCILELCQTSRESGGGARGHAEENGKQNYYHLVKPAVDAYVNIYQQKLHVLQMLPVYQLYIQKLSD